MSGWADGAVCRSCYRHDETEVHKILSEAQARAFAARNPEAVAYACPYGEGWHVSLPGVTTKHV